MRQHAALGGAVDRAVLAAEIGELGGDVDDAAARRCRAMTRSASRPTRNAPRRLTPISRSKSAAVVSSSGFSIRMPALLTRMSSPPRRGKRALEHRQHLRPRRRRRRATAKARPPRPLIAATTASISASGARSAIATWQPSAANAMRDRPADAARAAGDQRALAVERARHAITSPRSTLTACPVMLRARSEARNR